MLTGNNGILTQAQKTKKMTNEAQEKEKIELSVTTSRLKNIDNNVITMENLEDALEQQFGTNFSLKDNNDDTFLITITDSQRMYYINEDGIVIDDSNILKITTAEEFENFRTKVGKGDSFDNKAVILMNDINLNNWTPIGYIDDENIIKFNGNFNGLNHKITNLNINNPQKLYQGLFANTGSSARINSVVVTGSVTGGKYVGAIVGYNEGSIRNCGNEATVTCQYDVDGDWNPYSGGIVGYNYNGTINGCYNKGQVNSTRYSVGGIVGKSEVGIIKNCYNSTLISSNNGEVGGICGAIDKTIIYNMYNSGEIQAKGSSNAGIVGATNNDCKINNVYNIGQIQGDANVGGIIGTLNNNVIVEDSYNKGDCISNETVGGIVAGIYTDLNKVNNCYHYGNLKTGYPSEFQGPIIGNIINERIANNCEWYTDDQEYYNSIIGKTTIKFNENIDMKNVLDVVNGEKFFVSDGDNNKPKLYWE